MAIARFLTIDLGFTIKYNIKQSTVYQENAMKKNILKLMAVLTLSLLPLLAQAGPIHEAAKSGDIATLKTLLDKDPSLLYSQDELGKTPLHWATGRGQLETMKVLLDTYHADVNVRNKNQGTPLHVAASQAQPQAAIILIEHNAEIDARTKDNATPLHFAAYKGRKPGHIEAARILLEHHADPNARMNNGATPLSMAVSRNNKEIIQLLRKFGAGSSKGTGSIMMQE
jgi:cytohesin